MILKYISNKKIKLSLKNILNNLIMKLLSNIDKKIRN